MKAAFQNRVRACCLGFVAMLALPGASGVLAASGDEPASAGFWAAVDSVGKLYAIKGRQIADDVKTNYLQRAGGDPDDLDVPSAIIEDGFMDGGGEQPAAEAAPEADPEPAAPETVQQAAPAVSDDAPGSASMATKPRQHARTLFWKAAFNVRPYRPRPCLTAQRLR